MSAGFEAFSDLSIEQLFRMELDAQLPELTRSLLELEAGQESKPRLEALMRGAHCLKGAARIANFDGAVRVSHAMEDCFVAAVKGEPISRGMIDLMLAGVDMLGRIGGVDDATKRGPVEEKDIQQFLASLVALSAGVGATHDLEVPKLTVALPPADPAETRPSSELGRAVRVSADTLTRLLSLAGESVLIAGWVERFRASVLQMKTLQADLGRSLESIADTRQASTLEDVSQALGSARQQAEACLNAVTKRLDELNDFDQRTTQLSRRLHREVLQCRMRPLKEGITGVSRLVREVSRMLGKEVKLVTRGDQTPVDRDILERLETCIGHIVRNAIDHGIEAPEERVAAGKPAIGCLTIAAEHTAGALRIRIADDGRGIDPERLRRAVVRKGLSREEVAAQLSEAELLEFMFLPGFTSRDTVTEVSGRGYGLDAVHTIIKDLGGKLSVASQPGRDTTFELNLPLTLSVLRTLVVDVAGEPYAFPLGRLFRAVMLSPEQVDSIEGRLSFMLGNEQVGLVSAHQVLQLPGAATTGDLLHVVVLGAADRKFGLIVDAFLGEERVLVKPLDARLGKIKDVSAACVLPNGRPVLIFDVDDVMRSIELLISGGRLARPRDLVKETAERHKRVLVVDDSFTVRELERKVLAASGYEVGLAVDGLDGWNAICADRYDLVITDIDMPRMDGIELVRRIRHDARFDQTPVIIVSFKDREEDRRRGMDAGADYYLAKSSFDDESLRTAVVRLIGESVR
jgi:two-component system, chemotaxis family, sensor histidine kinase and response regulator WspE